MRWLTLVLVLGLSACAPMMDVRDEGEAGDLRARVVRFCDAVASGDVARVADQFSERMRVAILAAEAQGKAPHFSSRGEASGCRPGKVWYLGGSRRVMEVVYDGFTDRLDMWLSDQGRLSDLHYAVGEPRLSARVGVPSNTSRVF